ADYNRHLDEIAARVERLLLDAVRRRLLTTIDSLGSPRPDVITILRQWEAFRRLANQANLVGRFIRYNGEVIETELFKYRLTTLLDLVNALFPEFEGKQAFESELRALKGKLRNLTDNLLKEGNLNAGGKFEWVDSILVKCLRDGTWLLIDNVNLCSPAVLDRLNALLEPDGVLTIGERGVGPDGQLVTITPHPDFRLFMTMDPHNGEISRAMRNRGVEIYMSGPNEEEYSTLDLRSLIYHAGLKIQSHQDILLTVHEVMKQKNQGMEGPSIVLLLHAAFLIGQQISRGQSLYEAFLSSCSDVYVKPYTRRVVGNIGFLTFKQDLYDILKEILRDSSLLNERSKEPLEDKLLDSVTLTIPGIKESSLLANIKQQGSLIKAILEAITDAESLEINERVDILPHSLLIFYYLATPNDTEFRHEWLTEVTSSEALNEHKNLMKDLCNIDDLPWDIRWLPSVAVLCRHTDHFKCSMCIAEYSTALMNGTLSDDITSDPVITRFSQLLLTFDECLEATLKCDDVELDTAQCSALQDSLEWRFRTLKTSAMARTTGEMKTKISVQFHFWSLLLEKITITIGNFFPYDIFALLYIGSTIRRLAGVEEQTQSTQKRMKMSSVRCERSLTLDCPVMTNLVTSYVMQNSICDVGATLSSHEEQQLLLEVLKQLLWRNMMFLSSPLLNYTCYDCYYYCKTLATFK
ncbi:hypothetical protein L9F63_023452, partial [Diploptera punctata]